MGVNAKILALNPGSTSTKLSLYAKGEIQAVESISHSAADLAAFKTIPDQLNFRREIVTDFMLKHQLTAHDLTAVVSRGGYLPPLAPGAYEINQTMLDYLSQSTQIQHASSLGATLAIELKKAGNNQPLALIYDPISVNQYTEIAKISGLKGIQRRGLTHALNIRAVAMKVTAELGLNFEHTNLIVAHLGGGNSINLIVNGKMIDTFSDDEGPFSTERTGGLPVASVIEQIQNSSLEEMSRLFKYAGGLKSYTGTNDIREIEAEIKTGNSYFSLIFDAYIYQIAKAIGALATVTDGKISRIILTGGAAHSDYLVKEIRKKTNFIAPLSVFPGELEMLALSQGAARVLAGEESLQEFKLP